METPPLSLASISSFLQSREVAVKVLDLNVELYHRVTPEKRKLWEMDYAHLWWETDSFYRQIKPLLEHEIEWAAERIMREDIDKVGFSLYAPNRLFSREVARIIKERSKKILIAGGRGVYDVLERRNFPPGLIDYFVVGEGEEALYKFLKGEEEVEGIISDPEEVVKPVFLKDLQDLPLLTYQEFDLAKYRDNAVCLLMNRGCIFKCAFCNDWRYIGKLRTRQAKKIYEEIEYHQRKNNIKKFYFNDQAINANPAELNRLCDLLIEAPFKVEWIALAIPWKFLTYDLLCKMRQAGCITLNYGIESGSNRVLQLMQKKFTAEEAGKVLEDTRKAGINTQVNFIVGFPGESEEDFTKTAEFIERNLENISGITNLNMCNATLGSDLLVNRERYSILLPEDTGKIDTHWFTENRDNTPRIRLERIKKLIKKAKSHKLHIFTTNLPRTLQADTFSRSQGKERVLLLMCPMWDVSIPPLGVGYLSAYLNSKGIPVDVLDINVETYVHSDSKRKNLWKMENYNLWAWEDLFKETRKYFAEDIEHYADKIIEKGYRVIGFSLYGANILFSAELAKRLKQKKPDLFIIFGGPSCSFLYNDAVMPLRFMISFKSSDYFAEPGVVDAFVIGEGEETTCQLINSLLSGNMHPLPGAIIYLNGKYTAPSHPSLIKNLDEIPFPAWEKFPLHLYPSRNTLPILFSRGCVNKCTFCNDWKIWQGKYRYRPAYNIFREMKTMHEKFNTEIFQCNDLMFNGSLKRLEELSEYLINANLNIQWNAQGTIRREMSPSLLQKLRESGLNWITYGVESLSENVLKKMKKKYSFAEIKEVLRNTKKAGIGTSINLIVGFPGEREEDFSLTRKRLASIKEYVDEISSLNPCYVNADIELEKSPEKFSIKLPKGNWCYYWESLEGDNTYEIRKRRTRELLELAQDLGINVRFAGIYDEGKAGFERKAALKCEVGKKTSCRGEAGKLDILLINPPPWGVENPPLSLAFLSRYAREKGFSVESMDLNLKFYKKVSQEWKLLWHVENKNFWARDETYPLVESIVEELLDKSAEDILRKNPSLLGISVVDGKERITISLIKRLREKGARFPIILGGPSASTSQARQIFVDRIGEEILCYVVGEGEETLVEIAGRIKEGREIDGVRGAAVYHAGKCFYLPRPPIMPLDSIPYPDYHGFRIEQYPGDELFLEWSRGCIGKCAFCKNPRLVKQYRYHDSPWVVEGIEDYCKRLGVKKFTVVDPLLNGYLPQVEGICDLILKKGFRVEWSGQIAPRRDMSRELLVKMKKAGCYKLQIGVESGSSKVLKRMKKFYTAEDAEQVIRWAKEAGMRVETFIIVGFPGEGEKEFYQTYDFIERNADYIDKIKSINTLHLIEDTDVYTHHRDYGINLPEDNWHYMWWTEDGNDYQTRKRRGETLLRLAWDLGIPVQETNFREGKEHRVSNLSELRKAVNSLQKLTPPVKEVVKVVEVEDKKIINALEEEKNRLREELDSILQSRGWRLLKRIVRFKRGLRLSLRRILLLPRLSLLLLLTFCVESYLILKKRLKNITVFPE